MYCPNCGAENKDTAKFCKNCGQPLGVRAAPARRKRFWPALVALLMLAVVSVVAGVVGYRRLRPPTGKLPYTAETPAAVQHTFEAATGTDWDTGIGLKVSIPPAPTEGGVELVVERFAPEQIEEEVVALHSVYDISLVSTSTPQEHPPVTLTFEIPEGVDPRSAVILQWTEEGWALAECKEGLPGGTVSSDGKYIVVVREELSRYAICRWLVDHIFRHFENLPEPPPPSPIIEVGEAEPSSLYSGYQVVEVALESPTIWRSFGGTWYEIVVRSEDPVKVEGSGYLAPGEKRNLEIMFRSTGGHATVCLNTGGALPRATLDWADRLGVPGTEAEFLVDIVERFRDRPADWKDLVWVVKNLLVKLVWKVLGSVIKFYANLVPVSIDIATYINALTDYHPDLCVDASAEGATPTLVPPPIPPITPHKGGIAYVATEDDLRVIDVSDPANMRTIGSGSTTHGAVDVFVQENLAYVGGRYGNLRILDLSNPSEPNELGHADIPKGVLDTHATESYAFVTDSGGFLHVIDVSNPTTPLEVGRCGLSGGHTVQARGSLVYVATGWGLSVIDVSDPSAPVVIGEWGYDSSSIWVFDVEVSGDLAYGVANDCLWVIDVSEPTSPNKVGELSLPYAWEGVPTIDVCGTYAYIAMTGEDRQPILRVIDVSLPTDPYQVGTSPLVGQPKDIHVVGSHAYVAAGTAGLGLIDVGDPFNPHQIGYWDEIPALSSALAVFVTGSERQLPPEAPTPTQAPIPTQTPRAQEPASGGLAVQWSTTFGGSDNDDGRSIQQTSDGGYIMAGTTGSQGQGGRDVLLLKTDVRGNKVWERTFGSAGDEEGASVVQAADGGYVLAGFVGDESGGGDVWLIKTDANGNRIWDRKLGTSRYEERGRCVRQTSDGGYIIAGSAGQGREGPDEPLNIDALLIKTDPEGNEEWSRTFGDASWDDGNSVRQTSDGGYILVGQLWPFPRDHDYDAWVIKTDANGNEMWRRAFGTPEHSEFATAVEETSDGGYVIAGGTEIGAGEDSDVWLIRTDVNGNKVWNRTFGGAGYDVGTSVQQTSDGGYIIVGFILGADKGDVWLIKTDATGNRVWDSTFGGTGYDIGASVQQTSDGGYILVGFTESYGAGGRDVWLIKVGIGH